MIPVEVYLNERYIPIRGWSSGHLLPTDRHIFSHGDGTPDPGHTGERHGTPTDTTECATAFATARTMACMRHGTPAPQTRHGMRHGTR